MDAVSTSYSSRLDLADALAALGRDDESKKIEDDAMAAAKGFPDVLLQTAYTYAVNSIETVKGPNKPTTPHAREAPKTLCPTCHTVAASSSLGWF